MINQLLDQIAFTPFSLKNNQLEINKEKNKTYK